MNMNDEYDNITNCTNNENEDNKRSQIFNFINA